MINRKFFFDHVRIHLFGGSLKKAQVNGMTRILDEWERAHRNKDDRWLAYMLATTHHETDRTMQPIEEYGKGRGREYGKPDPVSGQAYYGRGFVQLTWKTNYEKMKRKLGMNLVDKPELALELNAATRIMFRGMMDGDFTGKKLFDYFSPAREDWVRARKIINGMDRANLVAEHAKNYYAAISHTT